jgi:DNA-binding XRE family transcriptional regulator
MQRFTMNRCGGVRVGVTLKTSDAQKLWEARVGAGMSLRDLAKALGVAPKDLGDLEHGRRIDPDLLARAQAEIAWQAPQ